MGFRHDTTLPSSLLAHLATIPDPRSARGRRYEWLYLLMLIVAAMMTGETSPTGISIWVCDRQQELVKALQPARRCVPHLSTLRRVLCQVSIEALEQAVGAYLQGVAAEMGESGQVETLTCERLTGQAVDGKTVRCATAHNARGENGENGVAGPATHLVAVVGHEHGMVWAQENAPVKLGERKAAEHLLAGLQLKGTVTTFDALHTSVKQAEQIRSAGGHYLFVVKRNQKRLYQEIDEAFSVLPPQGSCEQEFWQYEQCTLHYRGHGRTEQALLESTPALNAFLYFPDVVQVVRRTRSVRHHRTGEQSVHVEYLITSLPRSLVTLEQIAQLRRWHWTIENVTHYPRDVSFGEDRCQVHTGSAPEALAAFRNAVAGTLRVEGWPYLPNGFRYCRAHLQSLLRWIGIPAT
jgi:predicted transposase YbfD/YdcC